MSRRSLEALSEKRNGQITNHGDVLSWFEEQPLTIDQAAMAMALSPTTVRRYVADLVEAGYLRREYLRYPGPFIYHFVQED